MTRSATTVPPYSPDEPEWHRELVRASLGTADTVSFLYGFAHPAEVEAVRAELASLGFDRTRVDLREGAGLERWARDP